MGLVGRGIKGRGVKVWGALGEVRGALLEGASSGLQQRSTRRSFVPNPRCVSVSPPPQKNPDDNTTKKPNLELQRSDDRKISQLMVCEGIRVGERIKQTQQKE